MYNLAFCKFSARRYYCNNESVCMFHRLRMGKRDNALRTVSYAFNMISGMLFDLSFYPL